MLKWSTWFLYGLYAFGQWLCIKSERQGKKIPCRCQSGYVVWITFNYYLVGSKFFPSCFLSPDSWFLIHTFCIHLFLLINLKPASTGQTTRDIRPQYIIGPFKFTGLKGCYGQFSGTGTGNMEPKVCRVVNVTAKPVSWMSIMTIVLQNWTGSISLTNKQSKGKYFLRPTFLEPAPNIILKFWKCSGIERIHYRKVDWKNGCVFGNKNSETKIKISFRIRKSRIENNTLWKSRSIRDYCVLKIKIQKIKIKSPFWIRKFVTQKICSGKLNPKIYSWKWDLECIFIRTNFFKGIFVFFLEIGWVQETIAQSKIYF